MKKIVTILVDDNKLFLDYLTNLLDWDALGFHIVASCMNGSAAAKSYEKYSPELIITDIMMPKISGIDLLKMFLPKETGCKFIMLSSYDEFQYAKEAIRLGASDYILKNEIDAAFLTKKLTEIRKSFEADRIRASLVQKEQITNIFFDNYDNSELLSSRFLNSSYLFLFFEMIFPASILDINMDADTSCLNFLTYITSYRDDHFHSFQTIKFSKNKYLVLLQPMHTDINNRASCAHTLSKIMEYLGQNGLTSGILLYPSAPVTIGEFKKHFSDWSEYSILNLKENRSMKFDILVSCTHSLPEYRSFSCQRFEELLAIQQYDLALQLLKDWLQANSLCLVKSIFQLRYDIGVIYETIKACFHYFSTFFDIPAYKNTQVSFYSFLRQFINDLVELKSLYCKYQEMRFSPPIKAALEYIDEHMVHPDLSTLQISEHVYLSQSYFCTLFKQEVKKTINEYITERRINAARKLLEDSSYKIYEIAPLVGYSSSQYFSQVFIATMGMTPSQYRKEIL